MEVNRRPDPATFPNDPEGQIVWCCEHAAAHLRAFGPDPLIGPMLLLIRNLADRLKESER